MHNGYKLKFKRYDKEQAMVQFVQNAPSHECNVTNNVVSCKAEDKLFYTTLIIE